MSEPNGYLIHGTAFSSKEAAFEILVHNHEQELRFHKLWDEDAQPYYFEPQAQLTIPKSIADELDGFNPDKGETKIAVLIEGYNECFISDKLMQFCLIDNNLNLCALYLTGKALGVDLVKVVEND